MLRDYVRPGSPCRPPEEARWRRGRRSGVVTHFDDAELVLGRPRIGPRSGRRRLGLLQLLFAQRPATAYFAMTNRGVIAKKANRRSKADDNYRKLGHRLIRSVRPRSTTGATVHRVWQYPTTKLCVIGN